MWFVGYLDCSQKEERKLYKQNLDCKTLSLVHALTKIPLLDNDHAKFKLLYHCVDWMRHGKWCGKNYC